MDVALKAMLHDEVLIAPYTGTDAYGTPTYGTPVTVLGRIERRFETQATTTGALLLEETKVFLPETAVVDERSQVTLDDGTVAPIQGLKVVQDAQGNTDHFVVYL